MSYMAQSLTYVVDGRIWWRKLRQGNGLISSEATRPIRLRAFLRSEFLYIYISLIVSGWGNIEKKHGASFIESNFLCPFLSYIQVDVGVDLFNLISVSYDSL